LPNYLVLRSHLRKASPRIEPGLAGRQKTLNGMVPNVLLIPSTLNLMVKEFIYYCGPRQDMHYMKRKALHAHAIIVSSTVRCKVS
jgi:hypothetical protein